jgi:hypothetical protein
LLFTFRKLERFVPFSAGRAYPPIWANPPVSRLLEVASGMPSDRILAPRALDNPSQLQTLIIIDALDARGVCVPDIIVGLPQCGLRIEPVMAFTPRTMIAPDLARLVDKASTAAFDTPVISRLVQVLLTRAGIGAAHVQARGGLPLARLGDGLCSQSQAGKFKGPAQFLVY